MSNLTDAKKQIAAALNHHDDGRYGAARRAVQAAGESIDRAIKASDGIDPIANPTGAMGAQASNGPQPRSLDHEERRRRDQLKSCDLAYERELDRQLGYLTGYRK
jgi:hypothetical protein